MENLRLLRESYKLSQQKLADQIGSTQPQIHEYEHGTYEPDIQMLKTLANFFDTSIDYLVGNTTIRHKIEPVETFDLNKEEAELIGEYRKLNADARDSVKTIIGTLLDNKK